MGSLKYFRLTLSFTISYLYYVSTISAWWYIEFNRVFVFPGLELLIFIFPAINILCELPGIYVPLQFYFAYFSKLLPSEYVATPSGVCILLSLFTLSTILLTFSLNTLCALLSWTFVVNLELSYYFPGRFCRLWIWFLALLYTCSLFYQHDHHP